MKHELTTRRIILTILDALIIGVVIGILLAKQAYACGSITTCHGELVAQTVKAQTQLASAQSALHGSQSVNLRNLAVASTQPQITTQKQVPTYQWSTDLVPYEQITIKPQKIIYGGYCKYTPTK